MAAFVPIERKRENAKSKIFSNLLENQQSQPQQYRKNLHSAISATTQQETYHSLLA